MGHAPHGAPHNLVCALALWRRALIWCFSAAYRRPMTVCAWRRVGNLRGFGVWDAQHLCPWRMHTACCTGRWVLACVNDGEPFV